MKDQGFTLIEVIVVMAIVAILAGIMIPFVYRVWEGNEIELTRERMGEIKKALVGDPRLIQNGIRTHYGFVGDNGQLPFDIQLNTIKSNLAPGYDTKMFREFPTGSGIYLPVDVWGNPLEYSTTADAMGRLVSATLKSRGPDGQPGTSDDISDSMFQINVSEVTPTGLVQGNLNFVITNATASPVTPAYSALIGAIYKGGPGTSGCIGLNIGQINPGESKSVRQNFDSSFLSKLPIGKSEFFPTLYHNNTCTGSGTSSANNMAVFISEGLNVVFVNLQTINYTVSAP